MVRTWAPMTTVSVVMTAYDGARFVERQLGSILAQTLPPTQLLVGDDGSSDGTVDLVQATLDDAPFSWDVRRNSSRLGVSGNLEALLRRATGDVIFLADQDDEWVPEKIEVVLATFEAHREIQGVFSDASLIDASSEPLPGSLWEAVGFDRREQRRWATAPFDVLMRRNVATGATMAIRRAILPAVLPLSPHGWHDFWIAALLAERGVMSALDQQLVRYRLHGSNQAGVPRKGLQALRRAGGTGARTRQDQEAQLLDLVKRLEVSGARPPPTLLGRLDHLRYRNALPSRRPARLKAVLARVPKGDYWLFANGTRSVAADLLRFGQGRGAGRDTNPSG